jgi:hypothetical protein
MTPQSPFMVCAAIDPLRRAALEALLAEMTGRPGEADPQNAVLPFGDFRRLHFARLVLLEDLAATAPQPPPMLALLGDVDGTEADFLADLAARAGDGLRQLFGFCPGFTPGTDPLAWMRAHAAPPAANYVNWVGRTVQQVHEEAALHAALRARPPPATPAAPASAWAELVAFVRREEAAGRLTLTPPAPDPSGWRLGEIAHAAWMVVLLLAAAPLLLLGLLPYLWWLRRLETTDTPITPRPCSAHTARLSAIEDYDVSNQFSAYGMVKPGRFRRWTLVFLLWAANGTTRHIFTRGRLARVPTIHFARWVFLDDRRRLFFASNYDGSLDSYMDDFINKVAFGLNIVFSNGVGYPRTSWLILDGAKDEQAFKDYIRKRQLVTAVWYKAYPGLTTYDLARNAALRAAIDGPSPTDAQARRLLQML